MEKPKRLCPMAMGIPVKDAAGQKEYQCVEDECGWWDETRGVCAVKSGVEKLGEIAAALDGILSVLDER
jgi:hypothetical protein